MWNLKYVILSSGWMDGGTVLCSYSDVGFGALCRVGRVTSICIGVCHLHYNLDFLVYNV
jgi:hypothetical protein